MPPAAPLPLFSTPPVSVTSFPGRVRPLRVRTVTTCCLSPSVPAQLFQHTSKAVIQASFVLEPLLSTCVLMSLQCHFTRDCGEWGLDRALSLFACRPLPCPCPSWVGVDVLLRENMVNILMQSLWHFEKRDNTIFLFFALHSLVVCVIYRKTLNF